MNVAIHIRKAGRIISPAIEALALDEERENKMLIFNLIKNQIHEYVKEVLTFETPQLLDKIDDCFNVEEVQFLMHNDVNQFR